MRVTKAHRATIRNLGPFRPLLPHLTIRGQDYVDAVAAALNAIASEPESVAVALAKVIRLAVVAGKSTTWDDSLTNLNAACVAYVQALRAAKRGGR